MSSTLTLPQITYTCIAIPGAPSWWPRRQAGATLTYALDVSGEIDQSTDFVESATLAIAPSGAGEAVASNFVVSGPVLTATLSEGQPTRVYTMLFTLTCYNGLVYEFLVYQGVPPGLPGYQIPLPPSPGYGTPIDGSISLLANDGGILTTTDPLYPTQSGGLSAGDLWRNGDVVTVSGTTTPTAGSPAVLLSEISADGLLYIGGGNLLLTQPSTVGQLWNNGGIVSVAP
jgi:hypothetical protein